MERAILSALLVVSIGASAQNWTATDINGVTHVLQDELDQGRTVLVDVSAYWCIPCWSWHRSGVNEKLFAEFGPAGTGDLMVFFVDGDPGSTLALLQGGAGSVGDWTLGTDYPIIGPGGEGAAVATAYNVQSFPKLFMHCPGSTTAVELQTTGPWETFLATWRNACPAAFANGAIDAHLLDVDDKEFCPGEHPTTDVFNQGSAALTQATLELRRNGDLLETLPWSGSIEPFQHQVVTFPNTTITASDTYEAHITVAGDANNAGDAQEMILQPAPDAPGTFVSLELHTDNAANETSWQLLDENGTVLDHDPPGPYTANTTYTYQWSLNTNACYTFKILDQTGDGICCGAGNGYYRIRNTWGAPVNFIEGGAFYAFNEERDFHTPSATAVEEPMAQGSAIIVHGVGTDEVYVELPEPSQEPATIAVLDAGGRLITDRSITGGRLSIDLHDLVDGVYFIRVIGPRTNAVQRIVLQR